MPENISPETMESIRALCRRISVAHDLNDEIQRELYTHMEDKLLGYLSGGEKVTEEDAFILVREHFGDPVVIRKLLRETHTREVRVKWVQKISLLMMALWCSTAFEYALQGVFIFIFMNLPAWMLVSDTARIVMKYLLGGTGVISILFLWYVLLCWRRGMEREHQPWIVRHTVKFFRDFVPLFILGTVVFSIVFNIFNALIEHALNSGMLYIQNPNRTTEDMEVILRFMKTGQYVMINVAWIWWMSWPWRGVRSLLNGIGSIVILYILFIAVSFVFTEPDKVGTVFADAARNTGISVAAAIGIYLIYYSYRSILDRKLKQIG